MTTRLVRCLLAAAVGVATVWFVPSAGRAVESKLSSKVYLLAAPTDYLYWGVDPRDPEVSVASVTRTCPDLPWGPGTRPCTSQPVVGGTPGERVHQVQFAPGSRFDAPVHWSPANPLRFRLALSVEPAAAPYSVHLFVHSAANAGTTQSPAAVQVAPGVWEGTMTTGGPITPGGAEYFGVRIRSLVQRVSFTLLTAGNSWIELPHPAAGRSVPELLAQSPDSPLPRQFRSAHRSFAFNDDRWQVSSYSGDLQQARTFPVSNATDAAILYAWVEVFDTPFAYDAARPGSPDRRKLTTIPSLRVLGTGGEVLTSGANVGRLSDRATGRGMDTAATLDVPAGPLTLEVGPIAGSESDMRYTAYVLAVHGERTLRSLRWRFTPYEFEPVLHGRNPVVGSCPSAGERIPATSATRTFLVDLDWDGGLPSAKWTLGWNMPGIGQFGCGEQGTGDTLRMVAVGTPRVWSMGATPTRDSTFVSYRDTVFTMEVRYSYAPEVAPA